MSPPYRTDAPRPPVLLPRVRKPIQGARRLAAVSGITCVLGALAVLTAGERIAALFFALFGATFGWFYWWGLWARVHCHRSTGGDRLGPCYDCGAQWNMECVDVTLTTSNHALD